MNIKSNNGGVNEIGKTPPPPPPPLNSNEVSDKTCFLDIE